MLGADRAGADQGLEAGVAVSGSVHDTEVSVGAGERVEDAVGAGVGGKDVSERVDGEEGDSRRIGVRVEGNLNGECLRDISRPVIRWP